MSVKVDLVKDTGALILSDSSLQEVNWDAVCLVSVLSHGQKTEFGYRHVGSGFYEGWAPDVADTIRPIITLRELQASDGDRPWHQALIHIVRDGLKFNIQFECDDSTSWSPKVKSLDLSECAYSLRPLADR